MEKHKAKYVAKGFSQIEGIDYDETFTPVARYTSIKTIIAIVAAMGWKLHQMDVNTPFLNGIIEETFTLNIQKGLFSMRIFSPM